MNKMKRIAVVGGGPGGLTLARLLSVRGIACTVFEGDAHRAARQQGGSLDLHDESGVRALQEAGLEAEFRSLARYDDQYDALFDDQGKLCFELDDPGGGGRPEIDRTQLRDLLLASLPEGTVRWGSKIATIQPIDGGAHRLVDPSGASLGEFDLVVGADGAWSKVRPLLSSTKPEYTGILFVELNVDDIDGSHPELAKLLPKGKISIPGRSRAMIAQRSSGGQARVYVMFRVPSDWAENGGLDLSSPERARADVKKQLPGWSPALLRFVDEANDTIVPRPIVTLPPGHSWTHRAGITLLGDAAHVMPPFSGEGVNMAMLDATELAAAIAEGTDDAIEAYEKAMFVRAGEAARGAIEGCDFVSDDALAHTIAHFEEITRAGDRSA